MLTAIALKDQLHQRSMAARGFVHANPGGTLYFVDSANGNDGNLGFLEQHPFQTLARAAAVAGERDTILLNPGGSETLSAAIALTAADLKVVCPVGRGESGYTLTAAGTLDLLTVAGARNTFEGLILKHTGEEASASGINLAATADKAVIKNCIFDDSAIATTFTGAGVEITNACNDVLVEGCVFKECKFGVLFAVATGIDNAGAVIKNNKFWIGKADAFGVHASPAGDGTVLGIEVSGNRFYEALSTGDPAGTAWDGTDGANASQGPILFSAAVGQGLVDNNLAYTALGTGFDVLNAIHASADVDLIANRTSTGGDIEDAVATVDANVDIVLATAPRLAAKASSSPLTSGALFNFTGSIEILSIIGRVTTAIENQTTNVKLTVTPDALSAYDICANKDIDNFPVGTLLSITGTAANALVSATGVGSIAPLQASRVGATCVTGGVIGVVFGANSTGAIAWEIVWRPLSAGATLVAA